MFLCQKIKSRYKEICESPYKMASASRLKAFCDGFVSLFTVGQSAEIKLLDKNCKIPFAVRFDKDCLWLPVTVRIAQADGRFAYLSSPLVGIVICYKSDEEIAILSASSCKKDRMKFELVKLAAYTSTSMDFLYDEIKKFSDTNVNASLPLAHEPALTCRWHF